MGDELNDTIPEEWVGTWGTATQLVEPENNPPLPGLANNTLRQVVRVSIGGEYLRIRISNEFSANPVTMKSVWVAVSLGEGRIDVSSATNLTFNKESSVTLNPGDVVVSDPFMFALTPRMDVAISIHFGEVSAVLTGHPGSRTTSYILEGEQTGNPDFMEASTTDHWYFINGIEVLSSTAAAIAIIGNSITDGRGSTTNSQNRWTDIFSERLLNNSGTQHVSVLNMGIGGNCVLKNCKGPAAIDRFERDVINQQGVRWIVLFEGINDIGGTTSLAEANSVADSLIFAYEQMINKAHKMNLSIFGATIMPFKGSFYYEEFRDKARIRVNNWIRNSNKFDAVIDFDKFMQNPSDTVSLISTLHDNDFLHPNKHGHKKMGESVDLKLFE